MENSASKIIGILVITTVFIYSMFATYACVRLVTARHEMLNEVNDFVDKVTDTGICTDETLQNFYLDMASHGYAVDITVKRYESVVNPISQDTDKGTQVTYIPNSDISIYNQGDEIKVNVHFISDSSMSRIAYRVVHIYFPIIDFDIAGMVRN